MALSFEDSKKQLSQQTAVTMALSVDEPVAAVAVNETFSRNYNYRWYNNYADENMSYVDDNKNIVVDKTQINLTQETNSQFIPFEMARYYDGIDLNDMGLQFHYVNAEKKENYSTPINVTYSETRLRFGWLVDANATYLEGDLIFEIIAHGTNEKGEEYIWKTRPNGKLNILKSLAGNGMIKPSTDWYTEFVTSMDNKVHEAQTAATQAQEYAEEAKRVATDIDGVVTDAVNSKLTNYYTKSEIDTALQNVSVDLTGYATEDYVTQKIAEIPETDLTDYALKSEIPTVPTNVSEFTNDAGYLTEHQSLEGYATEQYVTDAVAKVDVSEQLKDYALKSEIPTVPTNVSAFTNDAGYLTEHQDLSDYALKTEVPSIDGLATEQYVKNAVAAVDVSEQLKDYAKSTEVDAKVNELKASVNTNTASISSLSTTVTDLQSEVNSIDKSPRLTYDATYNTEGDYSFILYEIENEGDSATEVRSEKAKFVIQGGGGSGGTSSTLKIEYITTTPLVITTNDNAVIEYRFSGTDSSGDAVLEGTATWKVGGKIVATNTALSGENSFDVTEYLSIGTQKVQLSITDAAGSLVTKTWTVQKIDVRIASTFNDQLTYPMGSVSFDYTPYGAIAKDVHFVLDGKEIGTVNTSASGIPMAYTIPAQTHGAHLLEAYITTTVNSNLIESNHIYKDIIWFDSESDVPVIGCTQQNFTALQYDSTNIVYTVFDPSTETPTVTLAVDNVVVSTLTLENSTNTWQYKATKPGKHTLTITCGSTVKTLHATIEELNINVEPVTAGLEFDFNPVGKSNNDADRLWSDGEVTMTVSDNFDWVNGGYQIDENGDQYFCVKSGTTATINYNLFADDPKKSGKEFKVVFKSTNVRKRDTSFITCMNGGIGLDMKVESANVYSSNGSLYSPYCEEDIIEFEFNINKDTDIPMVLTYEDGVANRPMIYTSDATFMQTNPQPITIGSADCDVYIYRMKAYSTSLTDRGILSNFIADARNADEMIARYNRNQIYDENGLLTPEVLAEKCPDLRIIMVDAPWFTNDKKNKVSDTTVTMIYKNGDPVLDNWTCTGAQHSGQGTSSNEYGYAGRNIDLIMNKDTSLFTLGDGVTTSKTITLTRDSVPTAYLNCKVNIASSENENNAQLARRYNEYNPFVRTAKLKDSKVKDTMEFYNCVIFIRENNTDIATHREFQDCEWHYYALGNVGDSKKTDNTRVNDKNDPKEFVVEILDYNVPLAEFPTGYVDEDGKKAICPVSEWKAGNTAYDYLYADYTYKDGEFESFGTESYEFRYEMKGLTDEQREVNINAWREMYKFVVTSTDEEFYANLKKYFVVDSALYYYLFTERYTMVDNRAKNLFLHYAKAYYTTEEAAAFAEEFGSEIPSKYIDDEMGAFNGGYRFDFTFDYDNDFERWSL